MSEGSSMAQFLLAGLDGAPWPAAGWPLAAIQLPGRGWAAQSTGQSRPATRDPASQVWGVHHCKCAVTQPRLTTDQWPAWCEGEAKLSTLPALLALDEAQRTEAKFEAGSPAERLHSVSRALCQRAAVQACSLPPARSPGRLSRLP